MFHNRIVAAFFVLWLQPGAGMAQDVTYLDELFETLRQPDLPNWQKVEKEIWAEWSKSGSPAMDLLLQRGRDAMEAEDFTKAIDHFTALTDHAPDFAEGWNARATAYFRQGLYGPSLADIRMVLALNPRHFGALMGLGAIMEETGHPRQAAAAYGAAAAIHPHDPDLKDALERLEEEVSGIRI